MVGRLSRGISKSSSTPDTHHSAPLSPPPSYDDNGHIQVPPVLLAETTTTTEVVTTTTHTTHFFSLPLWSKRRAATTISTTPPRSYPRISVDETGVTKRSNTLMVEKELPPTPEDSASHSPNASTPDEEYSSSAQRGRGEETRNSRDLGRPRPQLAGSDSGHSIPAISVPSDQPAYALAQAVLGVGLSPLMSQSSSSGSHSDVNTVSFAAPASDPSDSRFSIASIRRSRSSQRITASNSVPDPVDAGHGDGFVSRRTRGISLGPGSLLHSFTDSKGKGKDVTESSPQRPAVTRKSSFWSRRRTEVPTETPSPRVSPSPSKLGEPSLLSFPPVSPFNVDMTSSTQHQTPGISRSRSERANSFSSARALDDAPINPKRKPHKPRRPATADSSNSRSQNLSFPGSSRPTPPSPTTPPPTLLSVPPSRPSTSSGIPRPPSRPRSQTNPPLLHRLSINIFSPSPPTSTSANSAIFGNSLTNSPVGGSAVNSPRPSLQKHPVDPPKPRTDTESPETYLERLLAVVTKAEVGGILASSGDDFYARALQAYIDRFNFVEDPLDVALRKLLMDVGLPRETQQIDRVIEAFAKRYLQCNPKLFTSEDHPYILAFSLIMLHTDAFNKSNKRKMTKPDYVKNTRLPGVPSEVLDCYYDNIVFAPFIFIEDPLDVNGQRGVIPEKTARKLSTFGTGGSSPSVTTSGSLLGKSSKIDPYYLITNNLLGPLRVDVESYVPLENPYLPEGTAGPWNEEGIRRSFATASTIEVGAADTERMTAPFFGLSVGGAQSPLMANMGSFQDVPASTGEVWTLKVTKVGLLNRKDDVLKGGKKASNRKWKYWSMILTGSQLLLFRDSGWATALLAHSRSSDEQVVFPQSSVFKPDELLSVKDAVAVYDKSCTKYRHTFRLALPDGRQILFQADGENDLNEWISRINYSSAFKTAGVRMRALGMTWKDLELTGVAAATSHLHDKQHKRLSASSKIRSWNGPGPHDLMDMLTTPLNSSSEAATGRKSLTRRVTLMSGRNDLEADTPAAPEVDGAQQFKATFDQVKAELATGHWSSEESSLRSSIREKPSNASIRHPASSSDFADSSQLPSRSRIIQTKVEDLQSKITTSQSQLDSDLRFVRNIGTLTPFQRSTRDRLQVAVQNVAKRITQVRLDMAKMVCHRDVLSNDLEAERHDWFRAKSMALKAATESLQSRSNGHLPHMVVSRPEDTSDSSLLEVPPDMEHLPEPSIHDSFHTALDFGPEWLTSADDLTPADLLNTFGVLDSSATATPLSEGGTNSSRGSFPFPDANPSPQRVSRSSLEPVARSSSGTFSPDGEDSSVHHERFYTAPVIPDEQAEEWNKTRAAKRVSLVRMPSDLRLTGRPSRYGNGELSVSPLDENGSS